MKEIEHLRGRAEVPEPAGSGSDPPHASTASASTVGGAWAPPRAALLVGLLAVTVALLMAFVVSRGGSSADNGFDPYFFGEMGRSIAAGDGFEGFGTLITRRAPLYPLLIGAIYWIVGDHARVVLGVHCLLFAGTAMLAYDLGRRHFNPRTGVLAGVCCAFHPLLIRYVPSLHLETFLTFLFTLMVWCAYRFWQRPSLLNGMFLGVTAGLATLTKAVALLYPLVFIAAIILSVRAARRHDAHDGSHDGSHAVMPWKGFTVVLLSLGLTIMPWTIRNYVASDHFVLVSSGTSDAFLRGTIFSRLEFALLREPPYTDAENESNAYFERLSREAGTVWERDDYETDQILNEEAKRVIREEPGTVVRKTAVGLFTFWYQLTSLKNSLLILVCAIGMWCFAIVGWRRARTLGIAVWPFMLPVLYLNIMLALLLALGRYSAPILPSLAIVAAFGADAVLAKVRHEHA